MLHIIKQYKQEFMSFISIGLSGNKEAMGAGKDIAQKKNDFKNELKNALDNGSLSSTEAKKLLEMINSEKEDIISYTRNSAEKLINDLGVRGEGTWINKGSLKEKLKEIAGQTKTQESLAGDKDIVELEPITINGKVPENTVEQGLTETKEQVVSQTSDSFMGIDTGITSRKENLEEVNIGSLEDVISKGNLEKLVNDIKKALETDNIETYKYTNVLGVRNYSDIIPVLENAGYEINGFMGTNEAAGVVSIINGAYNTQEMINNNDLGYRDTIKILLDYNKDGLLDNDVHFYTKEKEFLTAIRNEGEFNNLLISLGYEGTGDLNTKFKENYYKARKEFKNKLAVVLDNRLNINPVEMLDSPKAVLEKVDTYNKFLEEIEKNPKYKEIEKKDKRLADLIKYQGAGLIAGSMNGGAISFDISEATYKFIDSLSIGYVNGTVGIVVDKKLYEDENFEFHAGMANFIPYATGSVKVYKSKLEDFKDIFPKEVEDGVKVNIGGAAFLTGNWMAGLDVSKLDEKTKDGIEDMTEKMSEALDSLLVKISEGVNFEELEGINKTQENKDAYNMLLDLNKSFGEAGITYLKEGALNNYKRELYENAKGLNFVGASVGIISAFGYLVPLIGVHGEYHSTTWKQTQKAGEKVYGGGAFEGIEVKDVELVDAVKNLDSSITFRTRTNKYSEVIMNPNLSINDRWNGFEKFANRKGNFSKELQDTINSFKNVVNAAKKEGVSTNEKWYIISTVTQLMKKSYSIDEGNIDTYNNKYDDLIKVKNERRSAYNELFGFNIDNESAEFDKRLIEAGEKGKISETTLTGISFDASASKQVGLERKTMKGVDVFFSNIQMLSDENGAIMVEITDQDKKNAFMDTLEGLETINSELIDNLVLGIDSGDIILYYYSDPDGLDDRIIPMKKSREGISVYKPEFDTDRYGILFGIDIKDHDKNGGTKVSSEPGEDNNGEISGGGSGGTTTGGQTGGTVTGGGFGG